MDNCNLYSKGKLIMEEEGYRGRKTSAVSWFSTISSEQTRTPIKKEKEIFIMILNIWKRWELQEKEEDKNAENIGI